MITKINKISSAIAILLLAMAFTACSPDEFEGADPNGLPTVSGVDFNLSVDQETNQMIANYTHPAGSGLQEQRGRHSHHRAAPG